MEGPNLRDADWYHALTLAERLASLRVVRAGHNAPIDGELAARRARRWHAQPPFNDPAFLAARFAADGLTDEEFHRLLGESIVAVRDRTPTPPTWLVAIGRAYTPPSSAALPPGCDAMLTPFAPLIAQGLVRLRAGVQPLRRAYAPRPFDPKPVEHSLLADLSWRLTELVGRAVQHDGHAVAAGPPPTAALDLLRRYPVLARRLVGEIERWAVAGRELLDRLRADRGVIQARFSPHAPVGVLVTLSGELGDRHRGGRAVRVARFSSGLRLVYKPRPLAAEARFQDLLRWLNERGASPPFRPLDILDRGTYGWAAFVEAAGCRTPAEIERFYRRQGGFLALLYALEATDCHEGNAIAAGEHPSWVDLETLCHARFPESTDGSAEQAAWSRLAHSVLRVGFLPQRFRSLAPAGADAHPARPPCATAATHLPRLGGMAHPPTAHAAELVAGFEHTYRLLLAHRAALLAEDGPLAPLAAAEVRVVLRHTAAYTALLRQSRHPAGLGDALEQDRLLDTLWGEVPARPYLRAALPAERRDLRRGDVPVFAAHAGSRDLFDGAGGRLADFFPASGLRGVRERLDRLGERDLAAQRWIIRASLATAPEWEPNELPWPAASPEADDRATPGRLVAAAGAIGDWLAARAVHGRDGATWLGVVPVAGGRWSLQPLALDLANGLPGVALFLAQLGAVGGEERFTALARAALGALRRQMSELAGGVAPPGAFAGWGGLLYTLAHLGTLWSDTTLLTAAGEAAISMSGAVDGAARLDLYGGVAGGLGGLLALYRRLPDPVVLAAARACAERLVAGVEEPGWWGGEGATAPVGLAHGTSGIAWVLAELAAAAGQDRFLSASRALLEGGPPAERGAPPTPGMGLALLRALRRRDDAPPRADLAAAVYTALEDATGADHTLDRGVPARLELLLQARSTLPHASARVRAPLERWAARTVADAATASWRCATPGNVPTPGLLSGLAGLGYGLLRVAAPARVPAILTLDLPQRPSV